MSPSLCPSAWLLPALHLASPHIVPWGYSSWALLGSLRRSREQEGTRALFQGSRPGFKLQILLCMELVLLAVLSTLPPSHHPGVHSVGPFFYPGTHSPGAGLPLFFPAGDTSPLLPCSALDCSPQTFGIPLSQVIANDRAHRQLQEAVRSSRRLCLEVEATVRTFQAQRHQRMGRSLVPCGALPEEPLPPTLPSSESWRQRRVRCELGGDGAGPEVLSSTASVG